MTNLFAIGSHPHKDGYLGWFRRVHKATNEILKDDDGKEIIFGSRLEAEAAAGRALTKYLNGDICSSGIIPSIRQVKRKAAEAVFKAAAE
jgi:hypothetical protein